MAKHKGEPIRLMSGEHGTLIVEEGDTYPKWYKPPAPSATIEPDETEEQ